jgi:hypothetical protein
MMTLFDAFGTDPRLEIEGVWVDWGELGCFKIAAWMNDKHRDALERLRGPYRALEFLGHAVTAARSDEIGIRAMAEAVLVDWRDVRGRDGAILDYSIDAAVALLAELKRFRQQVVAIATEAQTFRTMAEDKAAGN